MGWRPEKGLPLATSSELFPKWLSEPSRLPGAFEYKFVICRSNGSLAKWEDLESNRSVQLATASRARLDGRFGTKGKPLGRIIPAKNHIGANEEATIVSPTADL